MLPVKKDGSIIENRKTIGKCKAIKDVNLEENHCPQGEFIHLYYCKRCKHFKPVSNVT